jgi:FkbM family methyltransferase
MSVWSFLDSIRRGLRRPELRRHPIHAISRRMLWRLHWKRSPSTPMVINPWWRNLRIALPNTSNAALLFYRTHSDGDLAWLLQALLSPRMTFLDVGAHIGEFTLVGATMVGSAGKVLAVEPLPKCAEAIRRNAAMNGMNHVKVYEGALCDRSGRIGFLSDARQSGGWIAANPDQAAFETQAWTLDDFLLSVGITRVDVMKLDASGNELGALRGGSKSFRGGGIGTLVMKLYHPNVTQERFGYDSRESLSLLREWGFQSKLLVGLEAFPIFKPDDVDGLFDRLTYARTLVATK